MIYTNKKNQMDHSKKSESSYIGRVGDFIIYKTQLRTMHNEVYALRRIHSPLSLPPLYSSSELQDVYFHASFMIAEHFIQSFIMDAEGFAFRFLSISSRDQQAFMRHFYKACKIIREKISVDETNREAFEFIEDFAGHDCSFPVK